MHTRMLGFGCLIVGWSLAFASAGETKNGAGAEPLTISKIMLKAHVVAGGRGTQNALDQRVVNGKATEEEKALLASLYDSLSKKRPPKGDVEEWKQRTASLAEAAKAMAKGDEKARQRLPELLNCKSCHAKHRGV